MQGDVQESTAAPVDGRVSDVLHPPPSTPILWGRVNGGTAVMNSSCFLRTGVLDWQSSFNHKQTSVSDDSLQSAYRQSGSL